MLRCVNLLERMDGGHVLYHGKDILSGQMDVNEYRSKVGMVFQSFNLFNNSEQIYSFKTPLWQSIQSNARHYEYHQ